MKIISVVISIYLYLLSGFVYADKIKSPNDYLDNFIKGEKVTWLGIVDYVMVYKNPKDEVVINWLCKYIESAEQLDVRSIKDKVKNKQKVLIKVREPEHSSYFVTTLKTKEMPIEKAKEIAKGHSNSPPYCLRSAETVYIHEINGKTAVFIGGGSGGLLNKLELEYVK